MTRRSAPNRRLSRWQRPCTPQVAHPNLDMLTLPRRAAGDTPAQVDNATGLWRPDGTVVHSYNPARDVVAAILAYAWSMSDPDRSIAVRFFFHRKTMVTVSTVFVPALPNLSGTVPLLPGAVPLLWETLLFYNRPGYRLRSGPRWRYGSPQAALHGHRMVCATLRRDLQALRAPQQPTRAAAMRGVW